MPKEDTQFKPGNCANPNGRPKGTFSIVGMIKDKLQEIPKGQKETYAQLLVKKYMHKALVDGNDKIIRDLVDRIDGKAALKIDHTTNGESVNPIKVEFVSRNQSTDTESV